MTQACRTSKSIAFGLTAHLMTVRLSMAFQPRSESLGAMLGGGGLGCSAWYFVVPLLAVSSSVLFLPHARCLVLRSSPSSFMIRACPWRLGGGRSASGSRSPGGRPLLCCSWRRRRRLSVAPSRWGARAIQRWPPRRQRVLHTVLGRVPCGLRRERECQGRRLDVPPEIQR